MTKTAFELGQEIAEGKLDPVELTKSLLEAIDGHEAKSDIFTIVTHERAMEEAKAAQKRQSQGKLRSPLDGVPISWKDLFDSKDIATESGSPLLQGRTPKADCTLLQRATRSGLICIGKTQMSELAFSGLGINPNAGTPPNVHGVELAPGGSSSGAAASVAHDLVPIGIGSDTGGSVRIPAAWNDLVGLKTTASYLPLKGVVPLAPSFDTAGPLTKSVADAALMTSILADVKPVLPEPKPMFKCRFLINRTIVMEGLGKEQEAGFFAAIDRLAAAGATIEYDDIELFDDIVPLGPVLFPYEAWQAWGEEIDDNPDIVFEPVKNRFLAGRDITKEQFQTAWDKMMVLRQNYYQRTADYDAVLSPSVCIAPPKVQTLLEDVELFQKTNLLALRNTRFGNMFGLCSLTLPTTLPAAGIMFNAKPFGERDLIAIGLSAEKLLRD